MKTGVYAIVVNKFKKYIGSAINIDKRLDEHLNDLRRGDHHNKHLQRAFYKYGESNFDFVWIYECSEEELFLWEDIAINEEGTMNREKGYNLVSANRQEFSEETRRRMSESSKGKTFKHTEETKQKISDSKKGIKRPKEVIDRIVKSRAGIYTGDNACNVKLTEKKVRRIKILLRDSWRMSELSEMFGVTYSCINSIKRGLNWKSVTI